MLNSYFSKDLISNHNLIIIITIHQRDKDGKNNKKSKLFNANEDVCFQILTLQFRIIITNELISMISFH